MTEERIKEVFANEEFVKELFSKETPEEVQVLLAEKDIDLTVAEIVKLGEIVAKKLQQTENGEPAELTEEELADVAGGVLPVLFAVAAVMGAAYMAIGAVTIARRTTGRW